MTLKPILVTGLMGCGKTSIANILISKFGFTRASMAEWIKQTVKTHYGLVDIDKSMVINDKPMRTILQEVGMYMRDIDPNWHLDEMLNKIKQNDIKLFVIDDLRFINESEKIRDEFDCITIKVTCDENKRIDRMIVRDSVIPTESQLNDKSESEVDNIPYNYIINNNGTASDLLDQLNVIIKEVLR